MEDIKEVEKIVNRRVVIYNGIENNNENDIIDTKMNKIIKQKTVEYNKVEMKDYVNYIFIVHEVNSGFKRNIKYDTVYREIRVRERVRIGEYKEGNIYRSMME